MRAGTKKASFFLQVKISGYMVILIALTKAACMVLPAIAHIKSVKILKLKRSNSNPAPSDPSSSVFLFTFYNDLRHTNGYDDRGVSMFI